MPRQLAEIRLAADGGVRPTCHLILFDMIASSLYILQPMVHPSLLASIIPLRPHIQPPHHATVRERVLTGDRHIFDSPLCGLLAVVGGLGLVHGGVCVCEWVLGCCCAVFRNDWKLVLLCSWLKRVGAGARPGRVISSICSVGRRRPHCPRDGTCMEMVPVKMALSCGCGGKSIHRAVAKTALAGRRRVAMPKRRASLSIGGSVNIAVQQTALPKTRAGQEGLLDSLPGGLLQVSSWPWR